MTSDALHRQHAALISGMGYADVSDRSQLEMLGKDRAQLLHGLCTNDIKALKPGEGCEAFLTSVQGKTIGYLYVFCGPESLILDSAPGETAKMIRNLDRYVIREDVRFVDLGQEQVEYLVSGRAAPAALEAWFGVSVPPAPLQHRSFDWRQARINLRRVPLTGPDCFLIATSRSHSAELSQALASAWTCCQAEAVEVARIEAGTPSFSRDVTEENLPQEIDRTAQAISFKKGCYLGQETVARLDSFGHVNRTLCGVRLFGEEVPPIGAEFRDDQQLIGRVTSACWSVRLNAPLVLAFIKRGFNQPGCRWCTPWGDAEVVRLPVG